MLISIVMVNLNGKKWLEKSLKSILKSNYSEFEIILVDNGSTDGSMEFVEKTYGDKTSIRIIQNKKNLGWSLANNQGIKAARGEIIVCLSNDMEVDPEWLKEIVKIMESDPQIGIVQCKSLSMWDRRTLDSAMNFLDKFGYAYAQAPEEKPTEVFLAEGMAFGVKREIIDRIGKLDDYYFMEYDDMDFSWRARLAGYKVYFAPASVVYHVRGGTVGATYFQRSPNVTLYTRNHVVTLIKNYELKNLFKVLPVVISIETVKTIYLFVKGYPKLAVATLKGLFRVLTDMKLIFRKRLEVQCRIRKISDKEVMRFMVPFNPKLLMSFLTLQAQGKRHLFQT